MRILTRLLPFIFETDDLTEWQQRFWWTKRRKRPRGLIQGALKIKDSTQQDGEVIFEGDAGGNEGDIPLIQSPISKSSTEDTTISNPLAEELLDTVLDFLSFSGFAIPTTYETGTESKVTMAIWHLPQIPS